MVRDVLALDQQVCFALYTASRAVTARYRPLLDELGITYPQYLVLLVLWEQDARTVKEIGTALRLDSSTLSPLLKRLEAAGLVTRARRTDDERSVTIQLTEAGAALRERARAVPARLVCDGGLEIGELDALRETLVRLTAALTDAALTDTTLTDITLIDAVPTDVASADTASADTALTAAVPTAAVPTEMAPTDLQGDAPDGSPVHR
jgi:DNA-binding MarR family transcriptional regulator